MGLRRSLIRTSRRNYVVTVPKEWVEDIFDRYGEVSEVVIDVHGDTLVIAPLVRR